MLSDEEVRKIARLARLSVSEAELSRLTKDVNAILRFVHQLEQYDVTGVEPMSHVHGISNVLRADVREPSLEREAGLANAPDSDGVYFRVPIIIEQKTEN